MKEVSGSEFMDKMKTLNRDEIKYIAMMTMLLNHIANIFLEPGTLVFTILLDIGYFTAPVMCWFLVEGYHYTRSKKRYAARLAVFALISEVPFCLAFSEAYNDVEGISFCGMNMIFTLLLCFGVLAVREHVQEEGLELSLYLFLFLLSMISDWAVLAPMFTLLFAWSRGDERRTKKSFLIGAGVFALMNFYPAASPGAFLYSLIYAFLSCCGILLAGIAVVYLYNGKRAEKGRTFFKWFFYLFYPVHLLILGIIRLVC